MVGEWARDLRVSTRRDLPTRLFPGCRPLAETNRDSVNGQRILCSRNRSQLSIGFDESESSAGQEKLVSDSSVALSLIFAIT